MRIHTPLALFLALATVSVASAQTQDLFRVTFRARCTSETDGGNRTVVMTDRDLITQCVGSGFTRAQLARNFALVFNPTADSIQVVNREDGTIICDAFTFVPVTEVTGNNTLQRLVFLFTPDSADAIGSAVITERPVDQNRARINGNMQFTTGSTNSADAQICVGTFIAGRLFAAGTNNPSALARANRAAARQAALETRQAARAARAEARQAAAAARAEARANRANRGTATNDGTDGIVTNDNTSSTNDPLVVVGGPAVVTNSTTSITTNVFGVGSL